MTDLTSPTKDPTSILSTLLDRRDDVEKKFRVTEQIPGWQDPEIYVTYKPIQFDEEERINSKFGDRADAATIKARAQDIIIAACESVHAQIDGEKFSFGEDPRGPLTRFDAAMSQRLGLSDTNARSIIEKLFVEDALLTLHVRAIDGITDKRFRENREDYAGE